MSQPIPCQSPTVCAVICAAGKGQRAGFDKNKLLVPFNGSNALTQTLSAFDFPAIDEMIVTASAEDFEEISAICANFPNAKVVLGGETRSHSVYNALQATKAEIVLIHDGARPFVTRNVIEGCIRSVETYGSGICALPCTDTVAVKATTNEIIRVPDRNLLVRIQTPQGFYLEEIKQAYEQAFAAGKRCVISHENGLKKSPKCIQMRAAAQYTDDSSVYNDFVSSPMLCEGAEENVKLTYPSDFAQFAKVERIGFGIDTHAFGKLQDYIVLAGVKIPSDSGLIAHSDGDVLVHAVMDALLSAAGLKDIGHYFPDTDEKWHHADSMMMLAQVIELIRAQGFGVKNISVAIQAEKPRMKKYIDEMKSSLANALQIPTTAVGLGAGTNEGLGYVGEGKGITVHAYVLLRALS